MASPPGNKIKVSCSLSGEFNTNQFPFPAMGIDDLESMAKEAITEALQSHLGNIQIKNIRVGLK
jgi:hypothetical protein